MATYEQKPGKLNVTFNRGDELGFILDLDIGTAGYSWSARVYSLVDDTTVATPTITVVDDATGKINLAMSETVSQSIPVGTYGLRVSWIAPGSVGRTGTDGILEVIR